jgi:hypothetical protein
MRIRDMQHAPKNYIALHEHPLTWRCTRHSMYLMGVAPVANACAARGGCPVWTENNVVSFGPCAR